MPISATFLPSFDARLIVTAGYISEPGVAISSGAAHRYTLVVSITFEDGTPCTGLSAENFLVVSYQSNRQAAVVSVDPLGSFIELKNEIPGIDFPGVYRLDLADQMVEFDNRLSGQVVYAIKVSLTIKNPLETRWHGQTVVSRG